MRSIDVDVFFLDRETDTEREGGRGSRQMMNQMNGGKKEIRMKKKEG